MVTTHARIYHIEIINWTCLLIYMFIYKTSRSIIILDNGISNPCDRKHKQISRAIIHF